MIRLSFVANDETEMTSPSIASSQHVNYRVGGGGGGQLK